MRVWGLEWGGGWRGEAGRAWNAEKPESTNMGSGKHEAPQSIMSARPVAR